MIAALNGRLQFGKRSVIPRLLSVFCGHRHPCLLRCVAVYERIRVSDCDDSSVDSGDDHNQRASDYQPHIGLFPPRLGQVGIRFAHSRVRS